ncbi:hypothetical protein ACIQRS_08105 [Streptomyces termitum]|uniref:Uncharacterized protein n=1 Tax=Streptomyces termitum TaxID=67368 RepID=A0A918SR01_9ACTN|nr:hypothetical protein [Streptomyces termitum]GHA65100.1 hypothetical protein GCM10010305_03390 [Streptomyces termitum]
MKYAGIAVLVVGAVGLAVTTRGVRGWENWTSRQKKGMSLSAFLFFLGIVLMNLGKSG